MSIADTLRALSEGDVMELGALFPGMAKGEKITWSVLESAETSQGLRLTFHLHWLGALVRPLVLTVAKDGTVREQEKANG